MAPWVGGISQKIKTGAVRYHFLPPPGAPTLTEEDRPQNSLLWPLQTKNGTRVGDGQAARLRGLGDSGLRRNVISRPHKCPTGPGWNSPGKGYENQLPLTRPTAFSLGNWHPRHASSSIYTHTHTHTLKSHSGLEKQNPSLGTREPSTGGEQNKATRKLLAAEQKH